MDVRTGIVMLNLGGPATLDAVEPFLTELFLDREIIQLPFQGVLGPFIAKRRAPKVQKLYRAIGGGSPILKLTRAQGEGLAWRLDERSPATAPHKCYVAFRYAPPTSADALREMQADGVERAIAFTQYPQYSCSTTGSSLNELWRTAERLGYENNQAWSVIDRWGTHPGFVAAMAETVEEGLRTFPPVERKDVLLLFSAHSLPLAVIDRGDPYPQEIGATTAAVMELLGYRNEYLLAYQSEVGPVRWLGPSTERVIRQLGARGQRNVLVIPIAFTSDHIETLSEIDREYGHLARQVGIRRFHRTTALNDRPAFLDALADVVLEHLQAGELHTRQFGFKCPGCTNPACREIPVRRVEVATPAPLSVLRA